MTMPVALGESDWCVSKRTNCFSRQARPRKSMQTWSRWPWRVAQLGGFRWKWGSASQSVEQLVIIAALVGQRVHHSRRHGSGKRNFLSTTPLLCTHFTGRTAGQDHLLLRNYFRIRTIKGNQSFLLIMCSSNSASNVVAVSGFLQTWSRGHHKMSENNRCRTQ